MGQLRASYPGANRLAQKPVGLRRVFDAVFGGEFPPHRVD
jgi:hypothetical protein